MIRPDYCCESSKDQASAALNGKLIDLASVRQAQVIVKQIELIQGAGK